MNLTTTTKRVINLELSEDEAKIIMLVLGRVSTSAKWSKPIEYIYADLRKILDIGYVGSEYIPHVIDTRNPDLDTLFS